MKRIINNSKFSNKQKMGGQSTPASYEKKEITNQHQYIYLILKLIWRTLNQQKYYLVLFFPLTAQLPNQDVSGDDLNTSWSYYLNTNFVSYYTQFECVMYTMRHIFLRGIPCPLMPITGPKCA